MNLLKMFQSTLVSALLASCGGTTDTGNLAGTSTGNPPGSVNIESAPYDSGLSALTRISMIQDFQSTSVSEFKFCITKMKLKAAGGASVTGSDGKEEIELELGWIDISDPSETVSWGKVTMPVGFSLEEMRVELHKDEELCANSASVAFNGRSLTKDLEFKFKFDPAVSVESGDTLKLGLGTIANALIEAAAASQLNDEDIDKFLENKEGTGSKK